MRLRDLKRWFKERLCRFVVWIAKSHDLSKDEADKRERLVQTYLVIFGLLLSYSGDPSLQAGLMKRFVAFLLVSLVYYSLLMRSVGSKPLRNLFAIAMSCVFSSAFVLCYVAFATHPDGIHPEDIWLLFLIITFTVAVPLLV